MLTVLLVTVRFCAAAGRLLRLVRRKVALSALRFYCWFLEISKSCLLLLVALAGLIGTLAQLLV